MRRPLQLTLFLTHDCTLRCRYCYAGRKYAHAMSRETAERGMDIGLAEAVRTERGLDLSFFGGEPLLEWDLLQHCCNYLKQQAAEQGVRVRLGAWKWQTVSSTILPPKQPRLFRSIIPPARAINNQQQNRYETQTDKHHDRCRTGAFAQLLRDSPRGFQ